MAKNIAQRSSLLQKFRIESIPNPIDTDLFSPIESIEARRKWNLPIDKKLILFGAMNISDPRKGFEYLSNALNFLAAENPESIQNIEIVVFGSANQDLNLNLPYKVNNLGLISSTNDLINVYSSSDVFVLPSLEDNLPNTIMESLECETPVVAFNSGGIPEMIDHCNNGFLAEYKSSKSLAEGIEFVLNHTNKEQLKYNSRKKILSNYQEKIIAEKYEMLYKSL